MTTSAPNAPAPATSEGSKKPLLLAAAVFLAVAGGSFAFLRNPAPESAGHSLPRGLENLPATNTETAKHLPSSPAAPAADSRDAGKTPSDVQRECLLQNVGSVNSSYLFQTYLNVGLLADASKNATYTNDEAIELLSTTMTVLQTVDAQMQKLENIGLEDEEVAAVKQARHVSALLKSQISQLQAHWNSGGKSSLDTFHQVRRESWAELRGLLGLAAQQPAKAE